MLSKQLPIFYEGMLVKRWHHSCNRQWPNGDQKSKISKYKFRIRSILQSLWWYGHCWGMKVQEMATSSFLIKNNWCLVVVNCVSLDFTLVMSLDIKTLWSKWFSQPQLSYFITYKVYMGFHSFMRPLIRWVFLDTS